MSNVSSSNTTINKVLVIGGILAAIYYFIGVTIYASNGISFFGKSENAIIAFGIILFVLGTFFGFYIYYKIRGIIRVNAPIPAILKRGVVLPFFILMAVNIGYTTFLIGRATQKKNVINGNKTRIVLFLPLNESLMSAYEDGIRQLTGFAEFLKENPESTRKFEFALYDHSMNYGVGLESTIRQEIEEGTKYFICTMSNVALPLSNDFDKIVNSAKYIGKKPVLICAVASAPSLILKEDLVHRFYIRSQEEADELAKLAAQKNMNSATFIAVDDDYGKGAVSEFKKRWKGKAQIEDGLFLDKKLQLADIENLIKERISKIPPANRQAIFVCHYGNGIDNIITALDNAKVEATIFATSTISIFDWQRPIKNILDKIEWYTCIPDYKTYRTGQNDVIKNFTTYVLYRLTRTIEAMGDKSRFGETWRNSKYPDNLDISWDGVDAIIPMRGVYKTEVNNPVMK